MLTLDDVLKLPTNPDEEHLRSLGLLPPAPAPAPPLVIGAQPASAPATSAAAPVAKMAKPTIPAHVADATPAPDVPLKPLTPPAQANADMGVKPMEPPKANLSFGERQALPTSSPGAPVGSAANYQAELERLKDRQANPWGTDENHPGVIGKIGHIAGRIGNIALTALAPEIATLIPGTDLNQKREANQLETKLGKAQTEERLGRNEKSEEGLRTAQTENLESEIREREGKQEQKLVTDAQGNVTGWQDRHGLHALTDPDTPDSIKKIAEDTQNKMVPKFEKDEQGNIVALKTDKDGKTTSEVVYKGDPKVETDLVHGHIADDGKPHTLLVNKKNGTLIKDLGAEKVPNAAAQEEHDIELVRATDPQGKVHLISKRDAEAAGYTHISKASDADVDKAKTHTVTLNDMQAKLNDVVASRNALDQDTTQRAIVARALRSLPKYTTLGQLVDAGLMNGSTPATQEYIQSVLSLRESALGLPKEITAGSRVSEIQASALWQTLPSGASLDSRYALGQARKFQANIDRLRERPEIVEGLHVTEPHPDVATPAEAPAHHAAPAAAAEPPKDKVSVYDPEGNEHFVLKDKKEAFLKDPKYKGWTDKAPEKKETEKK